MRKTRFCSYSLHNIRLQVYKNYYVTLFHIQTIKIYTLIKYKIVLK